MPEEIPPRNDGGSQDLGSVPMKPDPVPTTPKVPIGGGRATDPVRPIPPVSGLRPNTVGPPTAVPSGSSKLVIVGLSIAAAGFAAFSGYEFFQIRGLQEQLAEAAAQATTDSQTIQALESDLNKMREELDSANIAHASAMSEKDQAVRNAEAETKQVSERLEEEEEKNKELAGKVEAADAAIQEQARLLETELDELKNTNQELSDEKTKVDEEVERLAGELAKRNPPPSVPVVTKPGTPEPDPSLPPPYEEPEPPVRRPAGNLRAWVRLGEYQTGANKGRWYYVAPDGFQSPLYLSKDLAIQAAERRVGYRQRGFKKSGQIGGGGQTP